MDTLDRLRLRQPGYDGGKPVSRFERQSYPDPTGASVKDVETVLTGLVEALLIKARHAHQTESQVKDFLAHQISSLHRTGRSSIAKLMPTTYKALLSMLKDSGEGLALLVATTPHYISNHSSSFQDCALGRSSFSMTNALVDMCSDAPHGMQRFALVAGSRALGATI